MRRALSLGVVALLSAALHAQTSRDTGAIGGFVLGMPGERRLAGAAVSIAELHKTVVTDSTGAYQFAGVAPGDYIITARAIGYRPLDARVTLTSVRALVADLEMQPLPPTQLDPVVVRADSTLHGSAIGMARREKFSAGGFFMHAGALDSARGTPLSDLLRQRASGAKIVEYPKTGAFLLASKRGFTSISLKLPLADDSDKLSPAACYSQVYLDGVRIYAPGDKSPVPDLSRYDAASLEGVEYYPGPATTPPEYGGTGATCGTVVLWTRTR